MATYTIIGGNQKEYGPINGSDVRQWISEGRLNEQTQTRAEGETEWRALGTFPEFADLFAAQTPPPFASAATTTTATNWTERDYELDLGGCISRGWQLLGKHFGLLFVTAFVVILIEGAIGGLGAIPIIGGIFSIVNLVVVGPLMGGMYYVFIRTVRQEHAEVGEVFAGFSRAFLHLFLGHVVPALLAGLCLIPVLIVFLIVYLPMFRQGHASPEQFASSLTGSMVAVLSITLFICIIPMIYLQTCWAFTLPLIVDKQMDFWTAMGVSRQMVKRHWWHVFGLTILIGLVNMVGVLACCVGVLFTLPLGFAALMYAYETIFSEGPAA